MKIGTVGLISAAMAGILVMGLTGTSRAASATSEGTKSSNVVNTMAVQNAPVIKLGRATLEEYFQTNLGPVYRELTPGAAQQVRIATPQKAKHPVTGKA